MTDTKFTIPGTDLPPHLPGRKRGDSYLSDETETMDQTQRALEQEGHRRFARVHAREHQDKERNIAPEEGLQNEALQHPLLAEKQQYDGVDPNVSPEPAVNTEARREYDNARRNQEMEKQLRLGNMPKFSSAPKPEGP